MREVKPEMSRHAVAPRETIWAAVSDGSELGFIQGVCMSDPGLNMSEIVWARTPAAHVRSDSEIK